MSIVQSIFMGILQGITEFFPVSSSGHLAIFKNFFGVETETGILFDVMLHFATLIAIFLNGKMRNDIIKLIRAFIQIVIDVIKNIKIFFGNLSGAKEPYIKLGSTAYRRFTVMLIISTIPTGIIGVLIKDVVEGVSATLLVPGICLLATGVILLISDKIEDKGKKPKDATYIDAAAIGTAQGIATLPGLSRSGTTITACLLCGFDRDFAVRYSFIMSIPAILGAMVLELKDIGDVAITAVDMIGWILGMIFACVIGFFAIHFTSKIVANRYFKYFAYYCFGMGAISIIGFIIMAVL